jgi:nicotinamidase-related amidase
MKGRLSPLKKAFILNDYTVDLISPAGALYCGEGAQAIESAICEYLAMFTREGDFIAVCLDSHIKGDPFHPESKLFPPHNIENSAGGELYGKVREKVEEIRQKYPWQITVLQKNRYSAFAGTKLDLWLRSRKVNSITVSGVCTDMCVLHTVVEAYGLGYEITVPESVCFTPNESGAEFAFAHFKNALGVNVVK